MENDYISLEAVLTQLCNRHCAVDPDECPFKVTHDGAPGCFTAHDILQIPAADVRPVVFCKDCVYNNACLTQSFVEDASKIPFDRNAFFCADGKRKETET